MELQEILNALEHFKMCPKCNINDFWVGLKRDRPYVQCKGCGAKFELFEVYPMNGKSKNSQRFKFIRK